jgi:hypothetical protein
MFGRLRKAWVPQEGASLADALTRLGWLGFWMQIAIGAIPVALAAYAFAFGRQSGAATRGGLLLIDWLTVASLLLLAFTTFWFYRYTRLAARIADPEQRPSSLAVQRTVWTGVAASSVGIIFSMLILLFEVAQLLIYFLRAPQAGVPVVQTTATLAASWVSAADVMNLLALIIILFVEMVVLVLGLWLLFRSTTASAEFPHPATGEQG